MTDDSFRPLYAKIKLSGNSMNATVWHHRIDIRGATLSREEWNRLLDELKAEHVPSLTSSGKRVTVVLAPQDSMDAFIYRTQSTSDEEVVRILSKHGIEASIGTKQSENT